MALFDPKSRYAKAETYVTTDRRGRQVTALYPAGRPVQGALGDHARRVVVVSPDWIKMSSSPSPLKSPTR